LSALRQLAGQTAVYGLSSIVGRLLNYLLVPLYTRVFVPEEYGVVTELYAYTAFLIVIFTYGFETAYFRFSRHHDETSVYKTGLVSILISSALLITGLIAFSSPLSALLQYPDHPEYITWFAIILGADAISSMPYARLRQQNRALRFAMVRLTNIGVNIALNLFFLVLCPMMVSQGHGGYIDWIYNPAVGVGYIFISNLIASLITLLMLSPQMKLTGIKTDKSLWKGMMLFSLPLLAGGLAGMVNETLDRILLKYLLTDPETSLAQLGIYGACYKLSIFMTLFIQTYRYAAEPFFLSGTEKENVPFTMARTMRYFVAAGSFIYLVIMLFLDFFKHFIGSEYHEGLGVVPILLLANLLLGIYFNLSMWYKITGQTLFGAWFAFAGATITIVLNIWLIPLIGYMGSAWATLACYAFMVSVSYSYGQKNYPVPYQTGPILFYMALAIGLVYGKGQLMAVSGMTQQTSMVVSMLLALGYAALVAYLEKPKKIVP
jgi:O-antigen/teichoic acid export membrane protein